MTGRATYGELLLGAQRSIALGHASIGEQRVPDQAAALDVIAAYRNLADAAGQLGRAIGRADTVRVSRKLARAGKPLAWAPAESTATAAGQAWVRAARQLRAGAELLATHQSPHGWDRSPEATRLQDPDARAALAQGYKRVVHEIGLAAPAVIRRGEELAVQQSSVEPLRTFPTLRLPLASRNRGTGRPVVDIVDLSVARPGVTSGEGPLVEVVDRIARLRHVAWSAANSPNCSADLLRACAAIGALVNDAALVSARHPVAGTEHPPDTKAGPQLWLERAAATGDAWRSAHRALAHLRTPTAGGPALAEEVRTIRELLKTVTTPGRSIDSRAATSALCSAAKSFTDVASWNASAVSALHQSGLARLAGAGIPGEITTLSDGLTSVKLTGGTIPTPSFTVRQLNRAYQGVEVAGRSAKLQIDSPGL